ASQRSKSSSRRAGRLRLAGSHRLTMDAGAVDALIGAGVGGTIAFVAAYGAEWLRRRRAGRHAARLIAWEPRPTKKLMLDAEKQGPIFLPARPRTVAWDTHGAALADQVDRDTLDAVAIAYATADSFRRLIDDANEGRTVVEPGSDLSVDQLVAPVDAAISALS